MNPTYTAVSILITGRVQGVWFRASTKNEADRLGITGFVENLPDGVVYVEATGDPVKLDSFINWCHQGPELARVKEVTVRQINPSVMQRFEVRRFKH